MTRDEALAQLRDMKWEGKRRDLESDHSRADDILLDLVDDDEIRAAFEDIRRWYA